METITLEKDFGSNIIFMPCTGTSVLATFSNLIRSDLYAMRIK